MNAEKHSAFTGLRILVVEDDSIIAMELQDFLSELGADVVGPLPGVQAALERIGAALPDAAVLDVNLRGEMSTPVAAALAGAQVPFVLVTGYSRSQLDPELRDAPIVPKPVDPCELVTVLEGLLRQPRGG